MVSEPSATRRRGIIPTTGDMTMTTTQQKLNTYNGAVAAAVADPTDDNMAAVSAAYAALPAASRGGAMAAAMQSATPDTFAALIDAHNNLPTATSRVERRTVTEQEQDVIRRMIVDAIDTADMLTEDSSEVDPFVSDLLASAIDDVRRYVENKLNIGGGKRTVHNVEPTDVVPAGASILCTYKGGNVVGRLNADNTVTVGDETFPSLSKAAIAVTGQPTANGWVHWQYDGKKLATLRDAG